MMKLLLPILSSLPCAYCKEDVWNEIKLGSSKRLAELYPHLQTEYS